LEFAAEFQDKECVLGLIFISANFSMIT